MKNALSMRLLQFLAALCLLSVIPAKAAQSEDFTYTATATDVTITGYTGASRVVTIPETINGLSVTSIGQNAFQNKTSLFSVTIPNSVTSIGDFAFFGCSGLTSLTIPNRLTSIADYAFRGCGRLTSVTIPNSVTSIGRQAFYACTGLTSVTIPNSVTSIGDSAFQDCTGLTSVTIGNSVTSIGSVAFFGCSGLISVTIPNSVTSIGSNAFAYCQSLTSVTIPNSVTSIGSGAFQGCTGLTSVTIPNSVTSIGSNAFAYCQSLISVTIGSGVTAIGNEAFAYCYSLTSVSIPNSVTSIGSSAFQYCFGLTSVAIPNSVTSIGNAAFNRCSGLTSVSIPNSVTSIGIEAFYGCTGLTSVTISNLMTLGDLFPDSSILSVTLAEGIIAIRNSMFSGKSSLTSVAIPNSVTSIGDYAFQNCTSLTKITIPSSVTSIGSGLFSGCTILNTITVAPDNLNFSSVSGVLFNKSQTAIIGYPANRPGTAYTIPVSVTSIGDFAFYGSGLTSVSIPSSVTSIGDSAFYLCTKLASVSIPSSVTEIKKAAFSGSGLTSVTIPNNVTSIGVSAFSSCTKLASVSIPSSVTSIGANAFDLCTKLQAVFFEGNPPTVGTLGFSSGTIYYSFEANNWGASFAGRPTALILNPIIMSQPVSLSSNQGTTAILSVVAMGSNSLSYQWVKNGVDISGATGATLELGNVQATNAGSYKVRVGSEWGSVTSNAADLSVVVLISPPLITGQPSSIIANPGESEVFSVTATGSNLGYQWRRNGVIVAGATLPSLSFSAIQPVHVGTYAVVVTNAAGTVTSTSVSLTLNTVYSQAQYDVIAQAAQADIINSPNTYGLYSLSQVQALHVGTPLLMRDSVSGKFKLTVGVEKSTNLVDFSPMAIPVGAATINPQGKMEFEFTAPDNAAFFRVESR
jgi:hypothetical protein